MIATGPGQHAQHWGHEGETASIRGLVIFAVALLVSAVIIHVAIWLLMRAFASTHSVSPPVVPSDAAGFAGATHWTNPGDDLAKVRELEDAHLNGYAWADEAHTAARIPIQRAMQILVERGTAPARAATQWQPSPSSEHP